MKKLFFIISYLFFILFATPIEAHAVAGTIIGAIVGVILSATEIWGVSILTGMIVGGILGSVNYLSGRLSGDKAPGEESPTYKGPSPQITVDQGTPIGMAFGLCKIAGNIVRQNDIQNFDYIKLVICHGKGEWDAIIGSYINDFDWAKHPALAAPYYQKYHHLGTEDQSVVNNVFTDDEYSYRGLVMTELVATKADLIPSVNNFNVIARCIKCLEIGEGLGGTKSFTRNPAQIMWLFYIAIEKKKASELDENAFLALEEYCAQPMSYLDPYYSDVNPPIINDDVINPTSSLGDLYEAWRAFPLWQRRIGADRSTSWLSAFGQTTNQRLNVDFGRAVVITKITIDNYHKSGTETDRGIRHFKIQGSNSSSSFDDNSYASTGWTDIETGLECDEHAASDAVDTQEFIFSSSTTAYRYWSIVISDNWGDSNYMGVRKISFFGGRATGSVATEEYNTRYTFDYNFDSKISINDAKKLIWQSFHGCCIESQGKIKPVWEGAQEHDGAGSLQNKAVTFAFDTQTNVIAGSLSWNRITHSNVFIINHLDSSNDFKKDSVVLKNEDDINLRGEIVDDETCWYLIDRAVAKRRCKFNYNKTYREYGCTLTGFPASQAVEIYDRVTLTDAEAGWSAKDFIILDKDEDPYGRPVFYMEDYLSSIYSDHGFEEQPSYATQPVNNYEPPISIDDTTVSVSYSSPASSSIYASGKIRVQFTPPEASTYSYTEIWLATDADSPPVYRLAATDSDGDCYINGLGTFYSPGDTVYVKLRNVNNTTGVKEAIPSDYHASGSITAGSGDIITDHIATNSVTRMWADYDASGHSLSVGATFLDYPSYEVIGVTSEFTPKGYELLIFCTANLYAGTFGAGDSARFGLFIAKAISYVKSGTFTWTESGSGTNEYYLTTAASGQPDPLWYTAVREDCVDGYGSGLAAGTVGSLAAGEYDYGDNDSLGFSTIYVRLTDGSDPSGKSDGYVRGYYGINLIQGPYLNLYRGYGGLAIELFPVNTTHTPAADTYDISISMLAILVMDAGSLTGPSIGTFESNLTVVERRR